MWSSGGVAIFAEILVAELAHMGLVVIRKLAGVVPCCAFAAAGGIWASEEGGWPDRTFPVCAGQAGAAGLGTPRCPDPRPFLFPTPWPPPPALPPPIPSRVSPWASPFTKINRFFRLKARHLFGKAPGDGTVGPILTLDF